ncbi:DUF4097 family beta strand repeat-containing protein [Spirillospora sp. CA-294931]|uniref:DUF4097 family beta strand repeat-containing protein n=1 Tax=Spirillospora sp. CA-294931 TaxID=3240042 RepID=UPI003D8A6920
MTSRTLTAQRPGPIHLNVDLPVGKVTIVADRATEYAEVTITTTGDAAHLADAVEAAVVLWDTPSDTLSVTVPAVASTGRTVIGDVGTTIPAGASVTGLTITNSGVLAVSGDLVIDGVAVSGSGTVLGAGSGTIEVIARVPEDCQVAVRTESADVRAVGEYCDVDTVTVSGDVAVDSTLHLDAKSTSGDVFAEVTAVAVVHTVSGSVQLNRSEEARITSMNGSVRLPNCWGSVNLHSKSGDIGVHVTDIAEIRARSMSGDITITADAAMLRWNAVSVDAESKSGRVTTPRTSGGA